MILALVVTFSACGDSKPDDLPVAIDASATQSVKLIAGKGTTSSTDITFSIDDFKGLEKYAKWIASGEIGTASFMEMIVESVEGDVKLSEVKLALKSNPKTTYKIGQVTESTKYDKYSELEFLKYVVSEVGSKKSSTVVLSFKSENEITSGVEFKIHLDGEFKMKK